MLALSRADIRQAISMREAIDLVKFAFQELTAGRAVVPLRLGLDVVENRDVMLLMPAWLPNVPSLGFKVITIYPENRKRNVPSTNAMVIIMDPETGIAQAILDGTYLTQLRTGAISGAATEILARNDAKNLVVIGGGAQGVTQAAAVCTVRDIEQVTIVDMDEASFDRFRASIGTEWPEIADRLHFTTNGEAAIREADVLCLATTARTPVFDASWIRPGTHVNGIGSFTPEMQETPAEFVAAARVFADMKEHTLAETGDLITPITQGIITADHVVGELGELVDGTVTGRENDEQLTFFKSVGNAVQDMVVGSTAVARAREQGLGTAFEL